MATTEDIILRIALSGQDDVVARLGQIGDAGVGVMERLERAVTGGSSVFAGLTAAIAGVGAGLFYWANASSSAIDHMSNLASQSGTTISQISGLTQTLSAAGANTDQLGSAFRRLAFTIQGQWTQIAQSVEKSANDAVNSQLRLKESALSVEDAQEQLYQSKVKRDQLLGHEENPAEKQARELAAAYRDVERAALGVVKAEQAAREARQAEEKRERNDPETISRAIKSVAEGRQTFQQAGQEANLTFEKIVEGIIASAGTAGTAIQNFNGNLSDLIGKAPSVKEVFFNLADFMKNSGDDALNTALAYRVLGRGIGQDVVDAMKQGSAALQENIDRLEKMGLVLTDTDQKVAKEFIRSFHSLSGELLVTIQQIGTLFAPAFTEGFNTFRKFIETNHQAILDFARDVADRVKPIITDFFRIISGEDAQTEWVQNLVTGFKAFASFIKAEVVPAIEGFFNYLTDQQSDPGSRAEVWQKRFEALGTALKAVFNGVVFAVQLVITALDKVAALVNSIFGSSLTGGDIAIFAVILKLTSLLGGLTAAAVGTFGALSKLFGLVRSSALSAGAAELGATAGGAGAAGGATGIVRGLLGTPGAAEAAGAAAGAAGGLAVGGAAKAAAVALEPGAFIKALATTLSAGFAEAVGVSLGTVGLAALVSAGLTALFLKAIDDAKDEMDRQRKGRAGDTPDNEIPLEGSALDYLLGRTPKRTSEEFREQQRLRQLGYATSREEQEADQAAAQRAARDAYLNYNPNKFYEGATGRVVDDLSTGMSGRAVDLRALRDSWMKDYYDRLLREQQQQQQQQESSRKTLLGPGVPEGKSKKSPSEELLDRLLEQERNLGGDRSDRRFDERGGDIKGVGDKLGSAADKQSQAADKLGGAADKQSKAADERLPGKDWTTEDERMSGWTAEDQRSFELSGGPGADYYAKYGAQVADPRGGGGGEGLSELDTQASAAAQGLQNVASTLESSASQISSSIAGLSAAFEQASIQIVSAASEAGGVEAAEGGLIVGPGGPKDDQVPAMLSAGEYVVTADGSNIMDAIRHFGVRMAEGGTVMGAAYQAVAGQVVNVAAATVGHLGTVDLRTDFGQVRVSVSRAAMDEISRQAVEKTIRRGGKTPSWYRS